MGSASEDGDEQPVHPVRVSGFYMSKYEVTQEEWGELMGNNPSNFKGRKLPVENVSWYDAIDYCNRRSIKEGLIPVYTRSGDAVTWNRSANGYRLPTEAEWEYAARGGVQSRGYVYAGSNNAGDVGWYDGNSGSKTHDVGTKGGNELGLYDMSGNVWEWCWDWYGGYRLPVNLYNEPLTQTDPVGPDSGSDRVLRGGSWANYAQILRSAYRFSFWPSYRHNRDGVRLVRALLP
jgi:formylglycine-generating enzyme required for sulfatase activity